jgi:tRNA1Val (adenine37-N6)-methyltransferase
MNDYSQPLFYRFNSDSIELAKHVVNSIKGKKISKMADAFCGCGIIGMEILRSGLMVDELFFIEKNNEFISHLEVNKNLFLKIFLNQTTIHIENKDLLKTEHRSYDLIVANPPYFYSNKARPSPSQNKNKARFFDELTFFAVAVFMGSRLSPEGRAYILYRLDQVGEEQKDVEKSIQKMGRKCQFTHDFFKDVGLLTIF